MQLADCIFCKIAQREIPAYIIWEDTHHMAFLSRHPNTEGFTVVITKDHHTSYFAELSEEVRSRLLTAASSVARLLDDKFPDVGRTGLIFEGFGVNHIHAKLVPMHGTNSDDWQQRASSMATYFEQYQGYISSHDAAPADESTLEATYRKLTESS